MDDAFDAIVIGGGPAGATAAILLARAGWRVALVEKQIFPRRKVCGECIAASNLALLEALGTGQEFSRLAGPPLRQVALVCGSHMVRAPLPPYADPAHRWGVALGREYLDTLLIQQARNHGVAVFQPWQAYNLTGTPGNFQCRVRATDTRVEQLLVAPLLIDAHGSWEPLPTSAERQQAREHTRHRSSDLFAFKANFTNAALEPGLLPVLSFPGGYGGIVIGDHASATFAFCLRRDVLAQALLEHPGTSPAGAGANWVMQNCQALPDLLAAAVQCGKWLGAGPIRPGIRLEQRRLGMVFRIGNAAGEAHPIIGEGISMALQSGALLANVLACHKTGVLDERLQAHLQAEYAKAWHRHFASRIRLAAIFAHAAMRPQLFSGVLPALQRHPALLSHFARWCGKVRPSPGMPEQSPAVRYR